MVKKDGSKTSQAKAETAETGHRDLDLPAWFPAVLYAAVTLLLFRKFVFSGEMLLGQDTLSLGYMARAFFAEALKQGIFPLWNPIILGGTPFLDSLAGGDSLYPTSLLLLIMEPFRALGWKLIIHVFLAGLFTYGWVRSLGRSKAASLLAGLAFLLAPFMVTLVYPGHDGKLFVTALTPLLFWATERAISGGRLRAFGGMALVIGLVLFTTHFQQAYFLFGAVGIYAFVRAVLFWRGGWTPSRAGGRFALFLAFSVLGAGVAAVQLLPAVSYVMEFSRRTTTTVDATPQENRAYSSSWSLHPEEAASLVVPEFVGNSAGGAEWSTQTYWGRNVFKLNHEYGGLVVLLLAMVAFFGAPMRGVRCALLGIGGVALLFALGSHTPVWRVFYELLPGISLFRAPSTAAFLFGFGAVTLMAFGIDRVLGLGDGDPDGDRDWDAGEKLILRVLLGATGILLLGAVLASSGTLTDLWTGLFYRDLGPGKAEALVRAQSFITRGFFLATLLAGGTAGLVWSGIRRRIPVLAVVLGLGALVTVDLVRVNDAFIQTLDFHAWASPDPNIQYLVDQQGTQEPFKVLAMGSSGAGQEVRPGMYGLELAGGHHPNDLGRYRELTGMAGSGAPSNLVDPATGQPNLALLATLNVRYVIWPAFRFGAFPAGDPVMASTLDGESVYEAVYEIPTLPRARLVGRAIVLSDDEVVPYLLSTAYRPEEEVVVTTALETGLLGGSAQGAVTWLDRDPNLQRLSVESEGPALLVVADNWYPAWKGRVDGLETEVLRVNHSLRAVSVPAGQSEVELYYDGGSLRTPLMITLLSLLVVFGTLIPWARIRGQSSRTETAEAG
jgi:hypothetical protein